MMSIGNKKIEGFDSLIFQIYFNEIMIEKDIDFLDL